MSNDKPASLPERKVTPAEVDAATAAFPASVRDLMPPRAELASYRSGWGSRLFNDWFYCGLKSIDLTPKEGINKAKALRHITAIMGSFEPKHEDKEAACSLLFETWFEPSSKWERKEMRLGY